MKNVNGVKAFNSRSNVTHFVCGVKLDDEVKIGPFDVHAGILLIYITTHMGVVVGSPKMSRTVDIFFLVCTYSLEHRAALATVTVQLALQRATPSANTTSVVFKLFVRYVDYCTSTLCSH